jgi:hypothetical protein
MKCIRHPERDARVVCQKTSTGYCEECLENGLSCIDPNLYCKFRPQCIIFEMEKERNKELRRAAALS